MSRHNVWIPDDLWERAQAAARFESVIEDRQVSVSELIRRSLEGEISSIQERVDETELLS